MHRPASQTSAVRVSEILKDRMMRLFQFDVEDKSHVCIMNLLNINI